MTKLYPRLPDAATVGGPDQTLSGEQIRDFVLAQLGAHDFDGQRVTLVVPDSTRHAPSRSCATSSMRHRAAARRTFGWPSRWARTTT